MASMRERVQLMVNEIYRRDGAVRASVLVEEARPKHSPVHDAFEWDDKKAGNEYRLHQARSWIRKVEVIYGDRKERYVHVPSIVLSESVSGEGYYKPISVVVGDTEEYEAAKKAALATLNAAVAAFEELRQAAERTELDQRKRPDADMAEKGFGLVWRALA